MKSRTLNVLIESAKNRRFLPFKSVLLMSFFVKSVASVPKKYIHNNYVIYECIIESRHNLVILCLI